MSFLFLHLWILSSFGDIHCSMKTYPDYSDSNKVIQGYILFVDGDINEVIIFPDSSTAFRSINSLQNITGYRIPSTDNFDLYKLGKIASTYDVIVNFYPEDNKVIKKKITVGLIKARIKYRPWNIGMPKSVFSWEFNYNGDEFILKYLVDLEGGIVEAQPVEIKDLEKFKKFKGKQPPKRVI